MTTPNKNDVNAAESWEAEMRAFFKSDFPHVSPSFCNSFIPIVRKLRAQAGSEAMGWKDRLNAVRHLVESDTGFEADCTAGGMDKHATPKEKEYAALITRIYTLVHPAFADCSHENWEAENKKLMDDAKNEV